MKMVLKYLFLSVAFFCTGFLCSGHGEEKEAAVIPSGEPALRSVSVADTLAGPIPGLQDSLQRAAKLHGNYQFAEALQIYSRLVEEVSDSLQLLEVEDAAILTQNSINMMDFCSSPVVVAKQKFPVRDFFLFYPLPDASWRPVPNQLDTAGNGSIVKAMYVPEDSETIYYSVQDENGIRNICKTEKLDSVWSVPELLGENMTTSSDEVFPMLSSDGKALYFSSKGLYGIGGYDLYVSYWDEDQNEWGLPVNMGFPYSSPYDDFLYIDSPDGKYSMFASNRECTADSVYIYVLEYDSTPVRKAVENPEELKNLSLLNPIEDISRLDNGSIVDQNRNEQDGMDDYAVKLNVVRAITDTLNACAIQIDEARAQLQTESEEAEKSKWVTFISEKEELLPVLQDSLNKVRLQVQDLEMKFLMEGFSFDPESIQRDAEKEIVGASSSYTFTKNNMGDTLVMTVLQPEPKFDYSFKILPEGCFAEDNQLPEGLVYQIQMFASSRKATVKNLKGLSPVFERKKNNSTYIYSVGVFRSYKDVLEKLNKVKRCGFRSAFITAFMDGKPISVKAARTAEKNVRHLYTIRIFPTDGQSLSDSELALVKTLSSSDLVKSTSGGAISYLLGPFDNKKEADKILSMMKTGGLSNVTMESSVQK